MKAIADLAASDPLDQNRMFVFDGDPALDIPGMLAGRIGDLYASEERRRRQERTDRLMRQAVDYARE